MHQFMVLVLIPGGLLGISSDGNDRRIFWGLKFSIPGFFWVRKFGKYFFNSKQTRHENTAIDTVRLIS